MIDEKYIEHLKQELVEDVITIEEFEEAVEDEMNHPDWCEGGHPSCVWCFGR